MGGDESIKERIRETLFTGLNAALKATPVVFEAIGLGAVISAVTLKNPLLGEKLGELDGKLFLFEARDVGKKFYLRIKDRDIKVELHTARVPDVTMRGDFKTLFDVFTGREDPDTVFFSRKLEISGDTAAAIHLKNILASIQ